MHTGTAITRKWVMAGELVCQEDSPSRWYKHLYDQKHVVICECSTLAIPDEQMRKLVFLRRSPNLELQRTL